MTIFGNIQHLERKITETEQQLKHANKQIHNRMIQYIGHHGLLLALAVGDFKQSHISESVDNHLIMNERQLSCLFCKPRFDRLDDLWSIVVYSTETHKEIAIYPLTRSDMERIGLIESYTPVDEWNFKELFACESLAVETEERRRLENLIKQKTKELNDLKAKYRSL